MSTLRPRITKWVFTALGVSDDELVVLDGNGGDAEDVDGLLVCWGRLVGLGVVRVAIRLRMAVVVVAVRLVVSMVRRIMALLDMVWVHDTSLSRIAQGG